MPDTGAPWNIPYVAASDLVADWPTDNQTMAEAIADALDVAGAGIGSNVVQATFTGTQAISTTATTDITDLSATITPSSATAKVLVIGRVNYSVTATERAWFMLDRDGTEVFLGDAAGSRKRATHAAMEPANSDTMFDATMVYLDSPASSSAVVYKVRGATSSGTLRINRTSTNTDSADWARGTSSLIVIEVSA